VIRKRVPKWGTLFLGLPELNSIYFRYFLSFYQVLRAKELLMTGIGRTRRIKTKSSECGEITKGWFLRFYPIHPVYPCLKKG